MAYFGGSVPMMVISTWIAAFVWAAILGLPWRPWSTRERLNADPTPAGKTPDLSRITALMPARNEASVIERTLRALAAQGRLGAIVLVDDESDDGTAARAEALGLERLRIVRGTRPPPGWSGKLWALEQGLRSVETDYVLLLDADIELAPGVLPALTRHLREHTCDMVSIMATLPMNSGWERLLIPPFIYFFKLLYPFALANSPRSRVAAAAGGCILIAGRRLREMGGFAVLRDALIDDCTLAREVKRRGGRTWLGLSRDVIAVRPYERLADIWNMVARTAYTQLLYSPALLLLCTVLLGLTFIVPVLGLLSATPAAGAIALALMFASYAPTLRFYGLSLWWLPTLPLAATMYLAMTWTSAVRYFRGERSRWKNRTYERTAEGD